METTKKGFEPSPFVLDYVKKGRIVKRWYTASKSALSFVKILSSGIRIQEQHFKVRMLLLLARISFVLGLITPSWILTRKVYCSKQELAQGHDRNLSFHLPLHWYYRWKQRVGSRIFHYCYCIVMLVKQDSCKLLLVFANLKNLKYNF